MLALLLRGCLLNAVMMMMMMMLRRSVKAKDVSTPVSFLSLSNEIISCAFLSRKHVMPVDAHEVIAQPFPREGIPPAMFSRKGMARMKS